MFRRYTTRIVTFTKFLWAAVGSMSDFLPPFLWNLVFLMACGLQAGSAILVMPGLLMINIALKIYVDLLFAKIRNRFVRSITFMMGLLALYIEWRVLPGVQLALPYRDFIDNTISILPAITIRIVGLLLVAEVLACSLLLLYPRKFVENKARGAAATQADPELQVKLQKLLSILPQSGWVARQLLRFQAFLLGALDKYFFAGGALLVNTMNAFMSVIHAIHVFIVMRLVKARTAKPKTA
jgi:hypothetical protein